MDVYKEMAGGTAQINPMSDFIQETEERMKTLKPYFEGTGTRLGLVLPSYPFGDEDMYDYTKDVYYDYSEQEAKKLEPYMTLCNVGENTETCMKRIFECNPKESWDDCNKKIKTCPGEGEEIKLCKYENDILVGKYTRPPATLTSTQLVCKPEEEIESCLKRVYECDPDRPWRECDDSIMLCVDGSGSICKYGSKIKEPKELIKKYQISECNEFDYACNKKHYECDDLKPWKVCKDQLEECEGMMCKYSSEEYEIKRYESLID